MLDAKLRPWVDPPLNVGARLLSKTNITPNALTLMGFFFGMLGILCIALENYLAGLSFILLNRLFDGLDGSLARLKTMSDFGGYLDIVCDFLIYAGVACAFAIVNPKNAPWIAFLIFSYTGAMTSFLAYAIMAAKQGKQSEERGKKSLYYLGGLCEGTETILVMILMCLLPNYIPVIAFIYGIMCLITCLGRSYEAWKDFN
ncbi:MAG: CDP-alcohol phosphatidyltransferase family protein [Pseudomonadota bacterium]